MSTNRPLHVPAGYCHHINAQSILNGPWAMCYDCGARHVRAVLEATADGVLVTAGIRSIRRALREQPEIEVAASGFGPLVLRQAADGTLTGLLGGQPVKVHGLE